MFNALSFSLSLYLYLYLSISISISLHLIMIYDSLSRSKEHFLAFLLSELATTGSIDGNDYLIIRGNFQTKQINSVIKKYCADYVLCHNCRSHETSLTKENRLTFLICSSCGASKSVQTIKTGFQAQTARRKN